MLQEGGVTAVPILTTPFREVLDRHVSYWKVEGEFPVIVLDHPIQNLPAALLEARAQQLTDATFRHLK